MSRTPSKENIVNIFPSPFRITSEIALQYVWKAEEKVSKHTIVDQINSKKKKDQRSGIPLTRTMALVDNFLGNQQHGSSRLMMIQVSKLAED
ncbi:hypothetical protein OUZ56_006029 [Daphnia magna]|uniref:Uncharacterized protein n=1 Tax=Daphnia magna TaxID=35525 RepID=A0ABQ9YUG2_9CRUS|nr:hypothetical protein OUZ56_006029 [Daphnia magna]